MMQEVFEGRIQLTKKIGKISTSGSIKISDFVAEAFKAKEELGGLYEIKKLILKLQQHFEYEDLARILVFNSDRIYDSSGGIIQALFKSEGVDSAYKD